MFEAYKIGVRIGVTDATRGNILKIATQFAKAQTEASAFLKTLRAVNDELSRKTSWASSAARDFRNARREAEGYARAARSARASSGGGYSSSMMALGGMAMASSTPSYAGARGALPPGGVRLALAGPGGSGGGALAGSSWPFSGSGSGGSGGGSNGGGFGYGAFGRMMGGAMLARSGEVELGMLQQPVDEAARYQSAVARFQLFGLGDTLNAEAIKFAKGMKIVGTSMTDAVNFMGEAQGVFRESGLQGSAALNGAKLAAPMLAKIAFATSGLDEESQAKIHTQSLAMLRFVEMRGGLSSAKRFNEIANEGWKAIRSSGGNVAWEQLRQVMSTGGVAAQGLSDQALFGELEPVIGEMKGGGTGQALMTAFSRMNGLQRLMPRIFQHEVLRLGLWDRSKLTFNSQGGIKDMKGNPLVDSSLYSRSPFEYYQKVILPAFARAGITKQADVFRENAVLFGNTGGKMFSIMYRQQQQIEDSVNAQKKTLGIDQSVKVAKGTFQGQLVNYHKQMENLQIQLGTQILPMLIRALQWLNPKLAEAAAWVGQHSTLTKGLLLVFAGLGTLAMVSGAIVSIGGAFTLISGAITAGGGLGVGLMSIATGLAKLGPAIAVASSAILGWKVGSYINDHYVDGTKFGDWLGNAEAHVMAALGSKEAKDAIAANDKWKAHLASNYGATGHKTVQVNSTVNIDGRKVGQAVTQHQTREAVRPQTGMSSFDSSMMPGPIGYIGA